MGSLHRSAQGKMIDMDTLRSQNEHVRAVGNLNVNARGDIIDSHGRVINDNTKRVNEYYMKTALNRGIVAGERNTVGVPLTPEQMSESEQTTKPSRAKLAPDSAPKAQLTAEELEFDREDAQLQMPKKVDSSKKD
jgi:hypothetical protein